MKYRKKPIVIEAEKYEKGKHIEGFCYHHQHMNKIYPIPHIHTLEGIHIVSDGDWIITGVKGEKYPCKPDIFDLTYEPIREEESESHDGITHPVRYECKICGWSCSDINEENMIEDMDEHLYFEHKKEIYDKFVAEVWTKP